MCAAIHTEPKMSQTKKSRINRLLFLMPFVAKLNGGADGARTRDLQRDRAVIDLLKEG